MNTSSLDSEVRKLQKSGIVLPRNPERAIAEAREYRSMIDSVRGGDSANAHTLSQIKENNRLISTMGRQRRLSARKQGSIGSSDAWAAMPRFYDPMEYWDLSGLPWNMADEGHRHKLHKWLRLFYATHYLLPILVDIFTRFPLVGMDLYVKDESLAEWYKDLFFNQLDYQNFFVSMGREHWTVGEAFPLGSFNEYLGVWEREELLNPEDVIIKNFPLLGSRQLLINPPGYLRKLAQEKSPAKEYKQLEMNFKELIPYLLKNEHIPVSDVLLRQVANRLTDWDDHGTPILLRGLRTLMHEEKLMASQDAIAERLYSPLILAKLGAMDLGDGQGAYIPTIDELEQVRDDMDIALSSDFRLMVHHFALDIENVFGREQMPRLGDDFDRIERRLMQVFGINPQLLGGGASTMPYASSALHAEFMNQMLRTFQDTLKKHFRERALVVAEAQEHYDYEMRGSSKIPIYEEVIESYDEDGVPHIVTKPKLLVPELTFECLANGTRVSTPSGPVATESLKEGDEVIAWDLERDCAVQSRVTHSHDNGKQMVCRIKTTLGRVISTTEEHPFLTKEGWMEAGALRPGVELRIGTNVPAFRAPTITERDARFLGLIVGDGAVSCCESGGVPAICNVDQEILQWVDHYVSGFGCSLKAKESEVTHDITQNGQRVNPNPIKAFLRIHNLSGRNWSTKRVPSSVWAGGPGIWAAFLSGYLDADGTVKPDAHVGWDSGNQPLLKDCHDLLAFLGIRATLHQLKAYTFEGKFVENKFSYRLSISSKEGLNAVQRWLDPLVARKRSMSTRVKAVDERRAVTPVQAMEIKAVVASKSNRLSGPTYREIGERYEVSPSTVYRAVKGEYDELFDTWVSPAWDEVRHIELAEAPTWSLGIEGDHTHITEGLVTHNTLDLRDEATERQFLQTLRGMGVPISDQKLMVGVHFDVDDEEDHYNEELVRKTTKQQEAKMKTYKILKTRNLPIPPDLKAEVESVLTPPGGASPGVLPSTGPTPAGGGPPGPSGGPGEAIVMPPPPAGLGPNTKPAVPGGGPPPTTPQPAGGPAGGSTAPPASMERRPGMPRPAHVSTNGNGSNEWLEEKEDKIVKRLPKAKNSTLGVDKPKRYSIIDDSVEPLTLDKEVSESDSKSSGNP